MVVCCSEAPPRASQKLLLRTCMPGNVCNKPPYSQGYWPRNSSMNQWSSQPLWSDALCLSSSSPWLCPFRLLLKDTWHVWITLPWLKAFCQAIWCWVETLDGKPRFHWVTHKRDPLGHIPPLRYSFPGCIGECQNASGSWLSRLRTSSLPVPFLDYISKEQKTNKAC